MSNHANNNTSVSNEVTASGCFFLAKPCLQTHVHLLTTKQGEYLEALQTICDTGVVANLSQPTKARVLAALQMTGQTALVAQFMQHCDVVEVTKAVQFLDRPRFIKQLERRIVIIEQTHPNLKKVEENEGDTQDKKKKPSFKRRGRKGGRSGNKGNAGADATDQDKKRKTRVDLHRSKLKDQQILLKGTHAPTTEAQKSTAIKEIIASASLSGAFCRKVKRWAKDLKADFLEFIVLSQSFEYWKILADLVHFSPGDFALPCFLSAVHGGELPDGSFVKGMKQLGDAKDDELATQFKALAASHPRQLYQAFNFLRTQPRLLRNKEIASLLARNIPLTTAIWYLEELAQSSSSSNKEVPNIVSQRLRQESWMDQSSKVTDSFGKLLERILTFRKNGWDVADDLMAAAERRLSALKESWGAGQDNGDGLTVIFGDKSYSMTSAIQAATIMGAMISTCFGAELSFFDHTFRESPHARPSTVKHVLSICKQIRASGGTSLAAALWPYYREKKKIERIILVTDEEENTVCNGFMFAKLLAKYKEEVNDGVELLIICVDKGDAEFRSSLERNSIDCRRIEIDGTRPDLSKFDSTLNQIALLSNKKAAASSPSTTESDTVLVAVTEKEEKEQESDAVVALTSSPAQKDKPDVDDDFVVLDGEEW